MMSNTTCIPVFEAKRFVVDCVKAVGASESHATDLADLLIAADFRGHFSHGLNRIEVYVIDLQSGKTCAEGQPVVEKETSATALVDGRNLLGPVIGKYCTKLAIKKAKESGVGWVAARQSNHYGIAGYYTLMASDENMIGFSFTNTTPTVFTMRSADIQLGTNPISCAAPGTNGDAFVLDMATSTVAYGKVEVCNRKKETLPSGWGADKNGKVTHSPAEVLNGGGLLPLGGREISGGYKGFGLAMMVEVLCGILSGAAYGPNIRKWGTTERIADLGQCFIAVDPNAFCEGFENRLQDLMDSQRNLSPTDPNKPVMVAGDPERQHMKMCDQLGGIPYPSEVVVHMEEVGRNLNVKLMEEIIPKKY